MCIWSSEHHILTTFPPCTPIGESMTVLNTADWLLGCSSPSPASCSKDYGTEVHVCVNTTAKGPPVCGRTRVALIGFPLPCCVYFFLNAVLISWHRVCVLVFLRTALARSQLFQSIKIYKFSEEVCKYQGKFA